jgi:hypothetical protein
MQRNHSIYKQGKQIFENLPNSWKQELRQKKKKIPTRIADFLDYSES